MVELLDEFRLGPKHQCLVLGVMGIDVQAYIDAQKSGRLKREKAQEIARQIVKGMDYIWKCGVAHGGDSFVRLAWKMEMILTRSYRFVLEKRTFHGIECFYLI